MISSSRISSFDTSTGTGGRDGGGGDSICFVWIASCSSINMREGTLVGILTLNSIRKIAIETIKPICRCKF